MYGVRNLEKTIRFSLKSRPPERFPRPEMSQIKAEISLRTNLKLIFHKKCWIAMISMDSRFLLHKIYLTEKNYVGSNLML